MLVALVARFTSRTVAPARTAPVESITVPSIRPTVYCAHAHGTQERITNTSVVAPGVVARRCRSTKISPNWGLAGFPTRQPTQVHDHLAVGARICPKLADVGLARSASSGCSRSLECCFRSCGTLGEQFGYQRHCCQHGRGVKRGLVVFVFVEEHATDARPDDAGHAPGREQHAVVDAGILRAPEVRGCRTVHRQLRA